MRDIQICKFNIALLLRSFLLLQPVILLFYQENGLTVQTLFLFQGLFYLTSILAEIPVGYLSDTTSRRNLLLMSFSLFLFVIGMWLFIGGFWIILAGEILFAISKVMMDNAMSGYLYDYLDDRDKAQKMVKYYGYLNFFLAFGTAMAALAGTWTFAKFGSHTVLSVEFFLILISIFLILSIPNIKSDKVKTKLENYIQSAKEIYSNTSIRYYIYYSGILTSCSILLALSFQPLMQKSLFPIFMFGIVAFFNHFIRALSGIIAGKFRQYVNIRQMIIPLYFLYISAFLMVFFVLQCKNIAIISAILFVICLIIGCQLLFTIMHVSRLHKFVEIDKRGNLMSINNIISRSMTAVILISSKIFIDKLGLGEFFVIAFILFLIFSTYIMIKTHKVEEFV